MLSASARPYTVLAQKESEEIFEPLNGLLIIVVTLNFWDPLAMYRIPLSMIAIKWLVAAMTAGKNKMSFCKGVRSP
jgi:hypothetical protein